MRVITLTKAEFDWLFVELSVAWERARKYAADGEDGATEELQLVSDLVDKLEAHI